MDTANENNSDIKVILNQLQLARSEIKNLRQQMLSLKHAYRKDVEELKDALKSWSCSKCVDSEPTPSSSLTPPPEPEFPHNFIGHIDTMFCTKRGVPRQPGLLAQSQGALRLDRRVLTNPAHALQGLQNFSHIWIIFFFHANESTHIRAKVAPPRLNGIRTGVFATRSPHRPSPIGLSLVKVDSVEDDCILFSGVDMVDGTPVLDIKPYIPQYDTPYPAQVSRFPHASQSNTPQGDVLNDIQDGIHWERLPRESDGRSEDGDSILQDQSDTDFDFQDRLLVGEASQPSADEIDGEGTINEGLEFPSVRTLDGRDSDQVFVSVARDTSNSHLNRNYFDRSPMRSVSQREAPEGSEGGSPPSPAPPLASVRVADWITNSPVSRLGVQFSDDCLSKLDRLVTQSSALHTRSIIEAILTEDPRSVYIRERYADEPFTCVIERLHVTCFFDDSAHVCLVTDVEPINGSSTENNVAQES